jgi:3-phenylpropionate/trans-cinnamate dioxygenase ferredoxin reductase component
LVVDAVDVLVVGAGQAGVQVASALRSSRFTGSIGVVTDQVSEPYELPPLSKDYLKGERPFRRILLRAPVFWAQHHILLRRGCAVISVDPAAHRVGLADGTSVGYGRLVWTAGGYPRTLRCPGADLRGVHAVRTRRDVLLLRRDLKRAANVAVIGGGYIGLEVAAAANQLGKSVVVIEALDRVLSRVAGQTLSRFYEAEHRARGVDIRTGVRVSRLIGAGGRVRGVALEGGDVVKADVVVVGIGIHPAAAPLLAAGAKGDNGVEVDEYCRTSLPDVFAAGDLTAHPNPFAGGRIVRLESVQNATDQANTVAHAILGDLKPYAATPWFWSNQYDLKLQTVGLSATHDETIMRGDPSSRSFSIAYLKDDQIVAFDCVNAMRDYVQGRALLLRKSFDRSRLADPGVPLKEL